MVDESVALKVLLRERHWTYATFCVEYEKAAREIDDRLARTWPSRAQFHRWLAGDLRQLPHPDACRVLEALFPGWTVEQLFARSANHRPDALAATLSPGRVQRAAADSEIPIGQFQDVMAIYATRSQLMSNFPPHALFDDATSIRASGLSLNLICQQYGAHGLQRLVERGGSMQCLFLDPDGSAIRLREHEEDHVPGTLSELTRINIRLLQDRVRSQLSEDARSRLEIAVYDETIRFNIVLVDERLGIVQPYLPAMRGIDSPTFVVQRKWEDRGLFPVFEAIVSSLWTRARMV
ncbi:MAG TPA: DUF5919 domain-containing protein [Streptosporangiaceae bacterium]|nr:DUF5919 domain-containing protein [Streptosporangiaceae bacterium]